MKSSRNCPLRVNKERVEYFQDCVKCPHFDEAWHDRDSSSAFTCKLKQPEKKKTVRRVSLEMYV